MKTSEIGHQIDLVLEQMDALNDKLSKLSDELGVLQEEHARLLDEYEESKRIDLANFVASVQLDANTHGDAIGTICPYQAFDMLIQWAREGIEFPEGLTLDTFTAEWNHQIKEGW